MTKLELNPKVIVRSPRFPHDIELRDCWEELKELIKESSPDFYERISSLSFQQFQNTDKRLQETVSKYFNRAKYRSTPYGSFASVSNAELTYKTCQLKFSNSIIKHKFSSWKTRNTDITFDPESVLSGHSKIFSNTTFYRVADELRFIRKTDEKFEIAAIDFDKDIESMLLYCCRQRTFSEILNYQQGFDKDELLELLQDLISIQLLITCEQGIIIGEDYSKSTITNENGPHYIISERKVLSEGINAKVFKHLPELALKMQQINSVVKNEMLEQFIVDFNHRFEGMEVPILIVLDPETGIGYGDFANRGHDTIMQKVLKQKKSSDQKPPSTEFIKVIVDAIKNDSVINLENLPNTVPSPLALPNTFGALCTQVDDRLYLDSLGGTSANILAGRFALAVPKIREQCKEIASLESNSNPDVLFFDVGYSDEQDVDDINRRPCIYPYQLNILNYDTSIRPIGVNDLMVSVRNGKVILRSAALNKEVVPRAASAYNFTRSNLSLFRFLMDIQSQGLCINLMWQPKDIIAGLQYYPRVIFRNIIVAPAMWLVDSTIFIGTESKEQELSALTQHLKKNMHVQYFKIGNGDQTLLLNKSHPDDIGLLISLIKKNKSLYLQEAALPLCPTCIDSFGKPYLPQFNLTLQHTEKLIESSDFKNLEDQKLESKQWITPCMDWLYFEIFGEAQRLDTIMQQKIFPFLQLSFAHVEKWFFIRFNEGGEHIRLRLKLFNPDKNPHFISHLNEILKSEISNGFISEIVLRTYKKEIHRYSASLMEQIEMHFCEDSKYVFSLGIGNLSELQRCKLCLKIVMQLKSEGVFSAKEFHSLIWKMTGVYNDEFAISSSEFKEINKVYKTLQQEPIPLLSKQTMLQFDKFIASLSNLLLATSKTNKTKLFIDLFHMHINRLFISNQRFMELMVYSFCQINLVKEKSQNILYNPTEARA